MEFWRRRPFVHNALGFLLLLGGWVILGVFLWSAADALGLPIERKQQVIYLALLLVTILATKFFDRMPLAWVGLTGPPHRGIREFLSGIFLGGGMIVATWVPIAIMALVQQRNIALGGGESLEAMLIWTGLIVANACGEELLFRGYLFQRLIEIMGPLVATLLVSILFAAAHSSNPSMSPLALVNIFIGGIFFALCYLRSGSLWVPIGAHIAWNWMLAKAAGLPVSGSEFGDGLLRTPLLDPAVVTGGTFGPEGGIIVTLILVLGIYLLIRMRRFDHSPYAYAKVFRAIYHLQHPGGNKPAEG